MTIKSSSLSHDDVGPVHARIELLAFLKQFGERTRINVLFIDTRSLISGAKGELLLQFLFLPFHSPYKFYKINF